jgi:hypothetical protein
VKYADECGKHQGNGNLEAVISIQIVIDQRQVGNVECFNYLGFMINDARCTREIISKIAMAKTTFNNKNAFHRQIGLKSKEESGKVLVQCYILSIALCGTETWHFGKQNRNNWKVLNSGGGETLRILLGLSV